jgi:simple sugar transport system permease protein
VGVTAGRGWIAIALVIFGAWLPARVVLGALLFGGATAIGYLVQAKGIAISPYLLSMIPYLGAILLLTVPSLWRARTRRLLGAGPAALGVPFVRGAD